MTIQIIRNNRMLNNEGVIYCKIKMTMFVM